MNPTKRIFVNTIAQYAKSFINICLSLYTVPVIMDALGKSDYGIYCLIAGIVAMLSFITNAMVITTQRHISYYIGQGDAVYTRRIFSNSILLHVTVGLLLLIVIIPFRDFFVAHLNIEDCRRPIAGVVYVMSVIMIVISFITAPFKALLIAHENIVFISVVEVADGVIKLVMALLLLRINVDKLLIYSYMMTCVFAFEFIVFSLYSLSRYQECSPRHFIGDYNGRCLREIGGFAGWTTFSMGALMARSQGLAVLFNRFFDTLLNASYGIATHLYSAISFVSSSVTNAMNPQIMQAEGMNDRNRMLFLAEQESKLLTILMSLAFIPLIIEMDDILNIWLHHDVPEYATLLCQCLLWAFIADQTTFGLHAANQATGRIGGYTLIMYIPKLLFIAVAWAMFRANGSVRSVMVAYVLLEAVLALVRLPFMKRTAGLDVRHFMKDVYSKEMVLIAFLLLTGLLLDRLICCAADFVIVIILTVSIGAVLVWTVILTKVERDTIMKVAKLRGDR